MTARRGGGSDRSSPSPSAPPSTGSVPAPTSSSSTSAGSARAAIHRHDVGDVRRERAQAGGDRLLVADVGEDRAEDRQPRSRRPPGSCSPACAISASSPAVFSATVLPPVFGPVITRHAVGGDQIEVDRHRLGGRGRRVAPSASRAARHRGDQQRMARRRATRTRPSVESARLDAVDQQREPRACACITSSSVAASMRALADRRPARGTRRSARAGCGGSPRPPAPRARRCRC